jgi:alkylation response protein AidB-like acyl-CoA dehydrogenase
MQMVQSNEAAAYSSRGAAHNTREASTAKAFATEMVRRLIDRALSIHKGATEVRKLIVARELLEARELTRRQAIE